MVCLKILLNKTNGEGKGGRLNILYMLECTDHLGRYRKLVMRRG